MSSSRPDSQVGGSSRRPYVICHMVPSVDGKIVTKAWPLPRGLLSEYERTAATFDAEAWIIGRFSMEPYAGRAALPARSGRERIARTDFVARSDARRTRSRSIRAASSAGSPARSTRMRGGRR